jgi:glycosyltransferase involved in cell wall biosynthesis
VHVGLNLVFLVPGETGGMETAARQLIPALTEAAPAGWRFTAFVNRESRNEDFGAHDQVVVPVDARSRAQWVAGEQLHLPRLARHTDLVHSMGSTAPARGPFKRVVTIHDLHYKTMPEAHFGLRGLGMRVLVPLAARASHTVITDSNASRAEIVRHLKTPPEKVVVVHLGLGRPPGAATPEAELRERLDLLDRPVLLALSAKRPHKNLMTLLDGFAQLQDRPLLVLPGYPTEHEEELKARAGELGIARDVRFPGWTSDEDTEGLLRLATAFVHPALSEGFGLPPLEALARGLPVAVSDIPVLREVVGDHAAYFDPRDPAAIAGALRTVLAQPRHDGVTRFTWADAAAKTLEVYERLSRQSSTSRSRDRS